MPEQYIRAVTMAAMLKNHVSMAPAQYLDQHAPRRKLLQADVYQPPCAAWRVFS